MLNKSKSITRLIGFVLVSVLIACNFPVEASSVRVNSTHAPTLEQDAQEEAVPNAYATVGPQQMFLPTVVRTETTQLFGVSLTPLNDQGGMTVFRNANTVWTRAGVDWKFVQPSAGPRDWNNPSFLAREAEIKAAAAQGYKIVLILGETPDWAVKQGFKCGAIREDAWGEFIAYAAEVVRRFSASPYNVEYYELFNEPDAADVLGCWGDPLDTSYYGGQYYGKFLQAVYPALKAANPSAKFMVGGLLLGCNPTIELFKQNSAATCTDGNFFEGVLVSGAKNAFDGVAFHAYDYFARVSETGEEWYENYNWASSWDTTGPVTLVKSRYLRDLLNKYGARDKFLMNTEIAVLCAFSAGQSCVDNLNKSPIKVYYVVYSFLASIADGYPAAIWYSSTGDNRGNGLINPDQTPTPAFNAFKFTATILKNAEYTRMLAPGSGLTGYELRAPGRRIWVIWGTDRLNHSVNLPSMPIAVYKLGPDGKSISLAPSQNLTINIEPVFIEFR
jgi:hypothetical protein